MTRAELAEAEKERLIAAYHRDREDVVEILYRLRDMARALGWIAETKHLRHVIALLAETKGVRGASDRGQGPEP